MLELHNKQKDFINSEKRYKLLAWGRRSGKTTAVGYEIFATLWNKNNALVSYYAPTFSDARDIAWEIYKEILSPITLSTNESLLEIVVRNHAGGTSILRMAGWESVKNRDKGRGVENDLVILDECAFYPMFKEKFEKVIEPTLLTSKGRLIMLSTPNGFNHFYDYANLAQVSDDWFYSHATSYDNPFNDQDDLKKLQESRDPDAFAQEYLAQFKKIQGLVYKEFNRETHVKKELPNHEKVVEKLGGVDFGFTNPTAICEVWKMKDGTYFVASEYYQVGKTNQEVIEYAKSMLLNVYYPDPAEPDRITEMRRAGLNCRDVNKDVLKGIDTVRTMFRNKQLFIHESCHNLIWELESYRFKEKRATDNSPEEPIKENDHLCDALRYVLYMQQPTVVIDRTRMIENAMARHRLSQNEVM